MPSVPPAPARLPITTLRSEILSEPVVTLIAGPAINVTTGSLKISLRNVVIGNLAGAGGTDGIAVSGSRLTLEDSVVQNVLHRGVYVTGTGGRVHVVNSTIRNTGNNAFQIEGGAVGVASG